MAETAMIGTGTDAIDAGAGNDFVWGNDGLDKVLGGDGDDTLSGGAQKDHLDGGIGNDRLAHLFSSWLGPVAHGTHARAAAASASLDWSQILMRKRSGSVLSLPSTTVTMKLWLSWRLTVPSGSNSLASAVNNAGATLSADPRHHDHQT